MTGRDYSQSQHYRSDLFAHRQKMMVHQQESAVSPWNNSAQMIPDFSPQFPGCHKTACHGPNQVSAAIDRNSSTLVATDYLGTEPNQQ